MCVFHSKVTFLVIYIKKKKKEPTKNQPNKLLQCFVVVVVEIIVSYRKGPLNIRSAGEVHS